MHMKQGRLIARPSLAAMLLSAAAATTVAAAPAVAQQQTAPAAGPQQDQQQADIVVITGTSLRGEEPVGTTVEVFGADDLRDTGRANLTEALKVIPQVVNLGSDEGRGGGVQGAQGNVTQGKTINLRGLGVESTLLLLNGRRVTQSGTQGEGYDISQYPSNALSRLEVVADGASAIYGSDAVGGVINLITKRNYEGAELSFRQGWADGVTETRYGANYGLDWGSGDAFFAYEHYERGGLLGTDREEVTQDLRPWGGPDLRAAFASPGTIVVGTTLYAVPRNQNGVGLTGARLIPGTSNLEDINESRSLLVDQSQDIFFASVHQDITDKLEVWAEAHYSSRVYDGYGGTLNRGAFTAALTVPRSNPFFVHPTNPAAPNVTVRYSFKDTFPNSSHGAEEPFQIGAGATWEMFGDWVLDGFFTYSGNDSFRRAQQLWTFNLAAALADTNPATAFNPFCDTQAFSCHNPNTVKALTGYNLIRGELRQSDAVVKASGSLFELPGGKVSLAVGLEYYDADLDTLIETLTTTATPAPRLTVSSREVQSGFAEVLVPIFGDGNAVPGIQSLELSAAVRYDDYSDFGASTNPKFGVNWVPVDGLRFRASYGDSFRAPSLADIDARSTRTYGAATLFDPSINANIRALTLVGARDGLGPEEATIWTVGGDWDVMPGMRASLTYYDVEYSNRLTTVAAATILANQSVFGSLITRNPTADQVLAYMNTVYYTSAPENPAGIQAIIDAQSSNLGGEKQSGVDGAWSYSFDALDSEWSVGANFTKILNAEQQVAPTAPFVEILDRINYPVDLRARVNAGWTYGSFNVSAFVNYVDGYTNDSRTPAQAVESWTTLDLAATLTAPDDAPGWLSGTRFSVSLVNATDEDPPLVINTSAGVEGAYDSQNASVMGRFVSFEISKKF